jgi:hypothetical protein
MLGDVEVFRVRVVRKTRLFRASVPWYEDFLQRGESASAEGYWKGIPFSEENPRWEYLLDGAVCPA